MSSLPTLSPPRLPLQGLQAGFRRFTVAEYHDLIRQGHLTEDDNLELIEGYLVHKMSRNPPHDGAILRLTNRLLRLLPAGWIARFQSGITLSDSEPEPDGAIVRGDERTYDTRHPVPADFGIVIEVSESSLAADRTDKLRVYARAGIPECWIINLVDRQIEVYTVPSGPGVTPAYAARQDYPATDAVPLTLDGRPVGTIPVADLLP
jgi:Uma2 family endonuclease